MFEIKIYGEITNHQSLDANDYGYFNLTTLNNQLQLANKQDLLVRINSAGGDVEEGFAIYNALRRYATENKVIITTRCDGQCASIATIFFLAGDKRIVNNNVQPFIHNAWTFAVGDKNVMQKIAIELKDICERMAIFYSEHTDLTIEEATELMNNETYLTAEQCFAIRFATVIEIIERPKALARFNNKTNNMNAKAKAIFSKIEALFSDDSPKALIVYTQTNEILDFTDLPENGTPSVGDKATFKHVLATGEHTLSDGVTTYIFENGALSEIKVDQGEDIAAIKAENETLKTQVQELSAKIDSFKALASEFKANALNDGKQPFEPKKELESFNFKR